MRFYALLVAMNSMALGAQIGLISMLAPMVKKFFDLSGNETSFYEGVMIFGGIWGALGMSSLLDPMGRLSAFALSSALFLAGAAAVALAQSYAALMVGTSIIGLGSGLGLALDPLYISEISKKETRGHFVTFSEIFIVFGQLFGFCCGFLVEIFVKNDQRWRMIAAFGAVPPLLLLVAVAFFLPESPRWLAANGRIDDAKKVFTKSLAYTESEADLLVDAIIQDVTELNADVATLFTEGETDFFLTSSSPVSSAKQPWVALWRSAKGSQATREVLFLGIGIAAVQMLAGIDVLTFNFSFLMSSYGVHNSTTISGLLVIIGLGRFITCIIVSFYLDSAGRRPLLLFSSFGNALCITGIASALAIFQSTSSTEGSSYRAMILFGLSFMACISFEAGLGPGAWLVSSEILFTKIRLPALGLCTSTNRFVDAILVSCSALIKGLLGWVGLFAILACLATYALCFIFVHLPETKGKSLEEMFEYFDQLNRDSSSPKGRLLPKKNNTYGSSDSSSEKNYTTTPLLSFSASSLS